jgi:hypothetical protein
VPKRPIPRHPHPADSRNLYQVNIINKSLILISFYLKSLKSLDASHNDFKSIQIKGSGCKFTFEI